MLDPVLSRRVDETVTKESAALTKLSLAIHQNPELRWEEHKATAWICEYLEQAGLTQISMLTPVVRDRGPQR